MYPSIYHLSIYYLIIYLSISCRALYIKQNVKNAAKRQCLACVAFQPSFVVFLPAGHSNPRHLARVLYVFTVLPSASALSLVFRDDAYMGRAPLLVGAVCTTRTIDDTRPQTDPIDS